MQEPTPNSILIAGTHSGCGKTTVTLGLLAALTRSGVAVRPFKCGPDFIDPTLHKLVTGRESRNLDPWMCGAEFTRRTFAAHCPPGELGVIEGVMGMFDGGDSSAAALARLLGVPVVLVLDVKAAAESVAAVLKGFESMVPESAPAAVILNRVGSARHLELIRRAIGEHCRAEIIGHLPRELDFTIPHRHLGLHMGQEGPLSPKGLDKLAAAVSEHIDLPRLLELAGEVDLQFLLELGEKNAVPENKEAAGYSLGFSDPTRLVGADSPARFSSFSADILSASEATAASGHPCPPGSGRSPLNRAGESTGNPPWKFSRPPGEAGEPGEIDNRCADSSACSTATPFPTPVRLGVALDEAFCFYYQDNFDLLREAGAELVFFSPLTDSALPPDLDGLYLGGGYPELYAERLAANRPLLTAIGEWAEAGKVIYAECGGFIYLCRGVEDLDGVFHPLAGLFPTRAKMEHRLAALGYREVILQRKCPLGPAGTRLRGHEFHYSSIEAMPEEIERLYATEMGEGTGYQSKGVVAGYTHLHFGSQPGTAEALVAACKLPTTVHGASSSPFSRVRL